VTRASLRRELAKINVRRPKPEPSERLRDPRVRLIYIMLTLPVPLLDAEAALVGDPRVDELEAEAARRYPAIAETMRELNAAIAAAERDELVDLPSPSPDASAEAKHVLNGAHLRIDVPYGRMNKRWVKPEHGGITWDASTFDGATEVVIDTWAHRTKLLELTVNQLWGHYEADAGIMWYLQRHDMLDADGNVLPEALDDEGSS
jgi:hypothetical protein